MRCLDCGHFEEDHDVLDGCRQIMAGTGASAARCGCPSFVLDVPTPAEVLVRDAHAAGPEVAQEDDGEAQAEPLGGGMEAQPDGTTHSEPGPPVTLRCYRCGRLPAEIPDIVAMAESEGQTADAWVRDEEGTLNPENGHFACDECYIATGMPSRPAPARWVAP